MVTHVLSAFGKTAPDRIGPEDVAEWFDAASKNKPGAANGAFEILRSMMPDVLRLDLPVETDAVARGFRPRLSVAAPLPAPLTPPFDDAWNRPETPQTAAVWSTAAVAIVGGQPRLAQFWMTVPDNRERRRSGWGPYDGESGDFLFGDAAGAARAAPCDVLHGGADGERVSGLTGSGGGDDRTATVPDETADAGTAASYQPEFPIRSAGIATEVHRSARRSVHGSGIHGL